MFNIVYVVWKLKQKKESPDNLYYGILSILWAIFNPAGKNYPVFCI